MTGVFHLKMLDLMILVGNKPRLLIATFLLFFLASCGPDSQKNYLELSGFAQGTTFNIIYEDSLDRDFTNQLDSILEAFDLELSLYLDSSEISKFNGGNNHYYLSEKSSYIIECFKKSKELYKVTNGAFNPAVYPLVDYWGFISNNKSDSPISQTDIDSLLKITSFSDSSFFLVYDTLYDSEEQFQLSPFFCKINSKAKLDFNAIAQGFSVDVVGDFLLAKGIDNFMVEIGGEVSVQGLNPYGAPWKIGIDQPVDNSIPGENDFQCIVNLRNKALATSGSYRKYYEKNGRRYSHTINPITGYPAENALLSVTVVTNKAADADAYATAFMVMGYQESLVFIEAHPELDIAAYFVHYTANGNQVKLTKSMEKYLVD